MQRIGLLCRDFTKLQKINDGVPMQEDSVPMQKDWVPMQGRTKLRMEQASPVKNTARSDMRYSASDTKTVLEES
jgi:hypothetical protein